MLSRPACPGLGVPTEIDDCIARCFEAHRRQVLRRRAARKKRHQAKYQQSFQTEQYQNIPSQQSFQTEHYQNIPPQPSIPPYYSNLIQDSTPYQTLIEPTNIPPPIQTSQQSTVEYSNINQSTTLPINTHYQRQIISTPEPYRELKQAQYTPQQFVPSYPNIIEQSQTHSEFQQSQDIYTPPYKPITYTNENITEYQAPISQVYDSSVNNQQIISSSIPTNTVEYTRQSYFSQEPISIQPTTNSYVEQIQSSDNQQYFDNYIPPESVQTYDQSIYTNEQIVPQQPSLPLYEEKQQHLVQQTTANEPVPSLPVTNEIYQQQEYSAINPPSYSFTPTVPPQPSSSSPPPSDDGSDDAKEDQEIFDLRACICRCYAKFRNSWIQDQQERYQEQFRDIQQPIIQTNEQNIQQIQQTIPPSIPPYIEPVPPSIPPYTQPVPPSIPPYIQPEISPRVSEQTVYQHFEPAPPLPQYSPHVPIPPQIPMRQPQRPRTRVPVPFRPPRIQQDFPRIDHKTGLCLVPCPETIKHAHLPPHLRPELICTEVPPASSLPPPPPPPPPPTPPPPPPPPPYYPPAPPPVYYPPPTASLPPAPAAIAQQDRWCVRCCCVPGKSLVKKVVYKQVEEEQQHEEESYVDYGSIIDQLETKISVRYGNSIMEEGEAYGSTYNEQLRIIDFPVYVGGANDSNLTPLVPDT